MKLIIIACNRFIIACHFCDDKTTAGLLPSQLKSTNRPISSTTGPFAITAGGYSSGMIPSWSVRNCPYSSGEKT